MYGKTFVSEDLTAELLLRTLTWSLKCSVL